MNIDTDDMTPAQLAELVAQLVREINHETQTETICWNLPSDAYDLVSEMVTVNRRQRQLFEQTMRLVTKLFDDGHLQADDLDDAYNETHAGLVRAMESTNETAHDLQRAHNALARIAWKETP